MSADSDQSAPEEPTAPPAASGEGLGDDLDADAAAAAAVIETDLAQVAAQRDEYLAVAQRLQAEFENYKKRVNRQLDEGRASGMAELAGKLLPVLDALESAIIQGIDGITPIHKVLFDTMTKDGLEIIAPDGDTFDPNLHEAVIHEPAEEGQTEPVITETLRTGYRWRGKVLRAAMVKVRG